MNHGERVETLNDPCRIGKANPHNLWLASPHSPKRRRYMIMSKSEQKVCGDCEKRLTKECPRCEWTDHETNLAACLPTDTTCEEFKQGKKRKKTKPTLKDSGVSDQGPFEAIYHNDLPAFLVKTGDGFEVWNQLTNNGAIYEPKDVKRIPYQPYGFYKGKVSSREELFWKVRNEFHSFVDVEGIWKDVLSACVLLSYQQEKLLTVPYVFLYGDNESGKSTVLQLLKFLCYRPMYGVTVPAADIYGYLEDVDSIGCVLEDEVQGIRKDIDKIKIYKAGYKEGAVVPRTLITQHDRIIKYYNTFSFKACASERIPQVKGFRERFLEISMVEGYPEKEWTDITKEDLKRLYDLRNMLLKWRLLSREWQLPNPQVSMRGRLKELWKPILQVTDGLTVYETLAGFVEEQKNERLSSKQNTLEGHIVKVVTELYNCVGSNPIPYIPFQTIWFKLAEDLDGKIDDKKPHVMDTSEFWHVTKNKVGYRLREVVSGKSKMVRDKDVEGNDKLVRAYVFDHEKLRRVAKKYGYEFVAEFLSYQSSQGVKVSNSTSKNHEKNVEKSLGTPQQLVKLRNLDTKEDNLATTCWICLKLLPKDQRDTTVEEGKPCHIECYKNLKVGMAG